MRFYVFEGVPNPAAFKRSYRVLLDGVRADELEKLRIVAECKRAFALNTAVFRALGEEFSSAAWIRSGEPCRPLRSGLPAGGP